VPSTLPATTAAPRNRPSVRHAAPRGRRESALPHGHVLAEPQECSVEVLYGAHRVQGRWCASKPSAVSLSLDRRVPLRVGVEAGEIVVHLHGTMAAFGGEAMSKGVSFGPHLAVRIEHSDVFTHECASRLIELCRQSGEMSALLADSLLRTLALHVFARYAAHAPDEPARYGNRLAEVLVRHLQAFIDARLDRHLSREDLARIAGYDAREFSAAFRNTFGMTPMQYVIERRLDRACLLIANTRRDLADIAISAGFSSQSHLTSTLKKRRGITPFRLRRQSTRAFAIGGTR